MLWHGFAHIYKGDELDDINTNRKFPSAQACEMILKGRIEN